MTERFECVRRLVQDPSMPDKCAVLINVTHVTSAPWDEDITPIITLIVRLQSRFKGRLAILNSRVGRTTTSHLMAEYANFGPEAVQAFIQENAALEWLRSG